MGFRAADLERFRDRTVPDLLPDALRLLFVGIKMSISHWYHINTYVSLAIIIVMLAAAIVFSVRRAENLRVGV